MRGRFLSEAHLYSTVLHENSHWSGAKVRLGRVLSRRFSSEAYAMEELVAEISAAFVCADLGIEHDPGDNTAAYVENWLKLLKLDSSAVITAAAKAQAVADYLQTLNLSNSTDCHPRNWSHLLFLSLRRVRCSNSPLQTDSSYSGQSHPRARFIVPADCQLTIRSSH